MYCLLRRSAFIIAEMKSHAALKALAAATPNSDVFRSFAEYSSTSLHLYTQVAEAGIDIRARMFAPLHNIPEDPATGSANVALIGLLAQLRREPDLSLAKTIMQGFEMGRPSLLQAVAAEKQNGVVTATFIGGRCVPVMKGEIELGRAQCARRSEARRGGMGSPAQRLARTPPTPSSSPAKAGDPVNAVDGARSPASAFAGSPGPGAQCPAAGR